MGGGAHRVSEPAYKTLLEVRAGQCGTVNLGGSDDGEVKVTPVKGKGLLKIVVSNEVRDMWIERI